MKRVIRRRNMASWATHWSSLLSTFFKMKLPPYICLFWRRRSRSSSWFWVISHFWAWLLYVVRNCLWKLLKFAHTWLIRLGRGLWLNWLVSRWPCSVWEPRPGLRTRNWLLVPCTLFISLRRLSMLMLRCICISRSFSLFSSATPLLSCAPLFLLLS